MATFAYANRPVLTVYAPDYFVSEWGPGPSIEEAFEKTCGCDLKFSAGDLVPRLILEGSSTEADIVIGLNTDVTKKTRETGCLSPTEQSNESLFYQSNGLITHFYHLTGHMFHSYMTKLRFLSPQRVLKT